MSVFRRLFVLSNERYLNVVKYAGRRYLSTQVTATKSNETEEKQHQPQKSVKPISQLSEYRFVYPEFLPDPNFEFRNKVREKLEREDMLKRRTVIDIPEFYVGSVLAVTVSDPFAPGKENRFVGICIERTYVGLRATFTLRNIVDRQGVEIMYDMYNPTLLFIEVLRLEKRLDDHLLYLRDAPPEYSTFPFDMEPEFITEGESVPINPLKVKLNLPPWTKKWEQRNLKGVEKLEGVPKGRRIKAKLNETPWENYDLMKEYRRCIPEEDQIEIWQDVDMQRKAHPVKRQLWKRTLQKAKPKQKQFK